MAAVVLEQFERSEENQVPVRLCALREWRDSWVRTASWPVRGWGATIRCLRPSGARYNPHPSPLFLATVGPPVVRRSLCLCRLRQVCLPRLGGASACETACEHHRPNVCRGHTACRARL